MDDIAKVRKATECWQSGSRVLDFGFKAEFLLLGTSQDRMSQNKDALTSSKRPLKATTTRCGQPERDSTTRALRHSGAFRKFRWGHGTVGRSLASLFLSVYVCRWVVSLSLSIFCFLGAGCEGGGLTVQTSRRMRLGLGLLGFGVGGPYRSPLVTGCVAQTGLQSWAYLGPNGCSRKASRMWIAPPCFQSSGVSRCRHSSIAELQHESLSLNATYPPNTCNFTTYLLLLEHVFPVEGGLVVGWKEPQQVDKTGKKFGLSGPSVSRNHPPGKYIIAFVNKGSGDQKSALLHDAFASLLDEYGHLEENLGSFVGWVQAVQAVQGPSHGENLLSEAQLCEVCLLTFLCWDLPPFTNSP